MTRPAIFLFICLSLLTGPAAYGKESGEKGGTADINIGVGEMNKSKARPRSTLRKPGPVRPKNTRGNPDRPVVPGSVPNTKKVRKKQPAARTRPSKDMIMKGKKILEN